MMRLPRCVGWVGGGDIHAATPLKRWVTAFKSTGQRHSATLHRKKGCHTNPALQWRVCFRQVAAPPTGMLAWCQNTGRVPRICTNDDTVSSK